jgi:hypothetical protein
MSDAVNPFLRIESLLGLHAELRVIYVVDGYEAALDSQDGRVEVARGKGRTLPEALADLDRILSTHPHPIEGS